MVDLREFDRHSMRCIFCKQDSSTSRTIEHIIPEALGNKDHFLPPGVVCDQCNNYFGLKIEEPLLGSDHFRQARFRNFIGNKEDRIPTIQGLLLPSIVPIEIFRDKEGQGIFPARERDLMHFIQSLRSRPEGKLIFLVAELPDEYLMSRFLAKTALEVLASRFLEISGGLDEVVNKRELDALRHYARSGSPPAYWPYYTRRIYLEGKVFGEATHKYEVLHEFTLLYTESSELYLVIAILGVEYVLNMGGPEIDGYVEWLKQHSFKSPLYIDNSA